MFNIEVNRVMWYRSILFYKCDVRKKLYLDDL